MHRRIKLLYLAAEPIEHNRLRLGEEIREIERVTLSAPKGRYVSIVSRWAVRPSDLVQALLRHRPQIVSLTFAGWRLKRRLRSRMERSR